MAELQYIKYSCRLGENLPDNIWLNIITNACPWLKKDARNEAAYNLYDEPVEPGTLSQEKIKNYLLCKKDYDAIDVSRIVTEYNAYLAKRKNTQ